MCIRHCLLGISRWMSRRHITLMPMEFSISASPQACLPHGPPILVNGNLSLQVAPGNTSVLSLTPFVLSLFTQAISKSSWLYLENTSGIQAPVTTSSAVTLAPATIISCLGYRNGLYWSPCFSSGHAPPLSLFSTQLPSVC